MEKTSDCHHCEGKGYTEIRDCGGDIQRTDQCSFCEGLGHVEVESEKPEFSQTNTSISL